MQKRVRQISKEEIEILREYISFNSETGDVTWAKNVGRKVKKGSRVGNKTDRWYLSFSLKGKRYLAHRAVWAMYTGEDPDGQIDHINGIRDDNRIENLRVVSNSINMQNQRKAKVTSKTGVLGVSPYRGKNRYVAQINSGGQTRYLGVFDTVESASDAYLSAKRALHPGCTL